LLLLKQRKLFENEKSETLKNDHYEKKLSFGSALFSNNVHERRR